MPEMENIFPYLGQISYALLLASYCFKQNAWLRSTAIAASLVVIFYSLNIAGGPFWIPIFWNLAFLVANGFHLGVVFWRNRQTNLDPLETFLSKTILANFPSVEVKSFSQCATQGILPQGERLIEMDTEIDALYCVLQGSAQVVDHGKKISELGAGRFVGEMSLLTHSKTRADVIAGTELKLLIWQHDAIDAWVGGDTMRLNLLQQALGNQIVEQLLQQKQSLPVPPPVMRRSG
jgi:hypothetical protein